METATTVQYVRRNPSCSCRMAWAVVICPKVLVPTVVPLGELKFTMLSAFEASARNSSLTRSLMGKLRKIAKSTFLYPGASRKFLGEFPSIGLPVVVGFFANAPVLNQQSCVPTGAVPPPGRLQLPERGSPINCARSLLVPSRLELTPFDTENGSPVCSRTIGEIDQPLMMLRITRLSPV